MYAIRHASHDQAPSLYHRWSRTRQGRAVASEPLETDQNDWVEAPRGSFHVFEGKSVRVEPFTPAGYARAA